ncbi:MAG TPA: FHA domain-containing protein [Trichocoleus sp.]
MAKLACYFTHISGPRILDTEGRDHDAEGHYQLEWTVGRGLGNDICLSSKPAVSKHHALIRFYPETRAWQLLDLNSLNGTWLNGEKIAPSAWQNLAEGDTIDFGTISARCRISFDTDDTLRSMEEETPSNLKSKAVAAITTAAEPEPASTEKLSKEEQLWVLAKDALDWLQTPIDLAGVIYRGFVLLAFLTAMSVVVIYK